MFLPQDGRAVRIAQFDFTEALGIRHSLSKALLPWPLAGGVLRRGKRLVHWYTGFQAHHEHPVPRSTGLSPPGGPPHFRCTSYQHHHNQTSRTQYGHTVPAPSTPTDTSPQMTTTHRRNNMSKASLQLILHGVYHKSHRCQKLHTHCHENYFEEKSREGEQLLGNPRQHMICFPFSHFNTLCFTWRQHLINVT